MKIYELELRIKDRFCAENEKEAKKEMVKRTQDTLKDGVSWRLSCKEQRGITCLI